jgi:predicted N-acetyltransferase YhbS
MSTDARPMRIERIPEWLLSAEDDARIADLLARSFATDFGGRSFFTHHHHLRLLVRNEGGIIGHMALVLRSVDLGAQRVTIAGLAEVATDPAHRGKGIAAALLKAAIEEARVSPASFLLLFGEAKVYHAAGFGSVSNRIAHIVMKGGRAGRVVTDGDDNLMVLPLKSDIWPATDLVDLRGPVF